MTNPDDTARADASLSQAIEQRLRQLQTNINTAMPCTVIAVNDDTVSVRLDIQRSFKGEAVEPIVVPDCPIVFPRSPAGGLSWPIRAGDTGLAVFSQRDVDRWCDGQAPALPATARLHDLSDALYIPGLAPMGSGGVPGRVTLESPATALTIDEAGTVEVAGPTVTATYGADGGVEVLGPAATLTMDPAGLVTLGNAAGALTITPDGTVALTGSGGALAVGPGGAITAGGGPGGSGDDIMGLLVDLVTVLTTTTVLPHSPGGAAALSSIPQLSTILARIKVLTQ